VGDISGNSRVNAADASLIAQFAALIEVPEIPPIPPGVSFAGEPRRPGPTVPAAPPLNDSNSSAVITHHSTAPRKQFPEIPHSTDAAGGSHVAADSDFSLPCSAVDHVMSDLGPRLVDEHDSVQPQPWKSSLEDLFAAANW
jgi:hypothetical protein